MRPSVPIRALVLLAMVLTAAPATAGEAALAERLARLFEQHLTDGPTRLLVVPPAPENSPIASDEAAEIMRRAATTAKARAGTADPKILATASDMARTLARVRRRQGRDGRRSRMQQWNERAGQALLAEMTPGADGLAVRLRLLDLDTGSVLGETRAVTLDRPAPDAAGVDNVLRKAARDFLAAAPEAGGARVGFAPLTEGPVDVPSDTGRYLARRMQDAWHKAAAKDAGLHGGAGTTTLLDGTGMSDQRFAVTGRLWHVDEDTAEVRLVLLENGDVRETARHRITLKSLPDHAVPAPGPPAEGFAPLIAARPGSGRAVLEMRTDAGASPVYTICNDPDAVRQCDTLSFALRPNREGAALCLALGNDGAFSLLAPAAHYDAPRLEDGAWTPMPDALPPGPDGGPVKWYARGQPGHTLVACYLFPKRSVIPVEALEARAGQTLEADGIQRVVDILKAAGPLASAHTIVTLQASGQWQ